MTQNNLYMEDDNLKLYVDVQPQYMDVLENSKTSAEQSAQSAQQSAMSASDSLNSIVNYKTNLELFYAQATNNLTLLLNNSLSALTNAKNTALESIQSLKNNVLSSINTALQNALNSINTLGQSIISQAHGYAQEAQNIVDYHVSEEYLVQSNALESGKVSDVTNIFEQINSYAHSTFNSSNFNTGGSVTVPSDGIITTITKDDYVYSPSFSFTNGFRIKGKLTGVIRGINSSPLSIGEAHNSIGSNQGFAIKITANGIQLHIRDNSAVDYISGTVPEITAETLGITDSNSHTVYYDIKIKDTNVVFKAKKEDGSWQTATGTLTGNYALSNVHIYLGGILWGSDTTIVTDLKQTEFFIDGFPYFSGNKTGLDVIKLDAYTSTGSPTITFDGILSYTTADEGNSKYITSPSITLGKTLDVFVKYKFTSYTSPARLFGEDAAHSILRAFGGTAGQDLRFTASDDSTLVLGSVVISNGKVGEWYTLHLSYDGTTYTATIYDDEGTIRGSMTPVVSALLPKYPTFNTQSGTNSNAYQFDLNNMKIYVDGDLVWQPCLKIPFTESKTGSKIVNSVYRNRVTDMYEQYGYAPYYTLSDSDFTLPMGELYGMIEKLKNLIIERTTI